jgi:hypothetical protein
MYTQAQTLTLNRATHLTLRPSKGHRTWIYCICRCVIYPKRTASRGYVRFLRKLRVGLRSSRLIKRTRWVYSTRRASTCPPRARQLATFLSPHSLLAATCARSLVPSRKIHGSCRLSWDHTICHDCCRGHNSRYYGDICCRRRSWPRLP